MIRRWITMNPFYGFRIAAAFESEQRWYDSNAYGGRMFFRWG
ncbi:MAG: SdpI family protein [Nitrospirae bacterium]|nr:SdpI family protein [Nitrospirota bacterium]